MGKINFQKYKILAVILSVTVTAGIGYLIVWAGNLNPPGAPAGTMRTLDEIYSHVGKGGLTKTGQTTSYATSSTCGDGGTGGCDDGYYEKGQALSYTDNGDGTMTDNNTGLMWKRCSEPDTQTSGCTGTHSTYTWQAAITQCEGLTYATYSDWRLPNAKELWSITKLEPGAAPYIDQTAFPGTVSNWYWSATTYPNYTDYALSVGFGYGYLNASGKASAYYVRCVRGQ